MKSTSLMTSAIALLLTLLFTADDSIHAQQRQREPVTVNTDDLNQNR